ncbi:hypothetical protein PMAYCL1PPCAC_14482, partial [Pristionchus mayeri]
SSSDPPMCTVLTRTLSLMDTVEKEGVNAESLGFGLAYMSRERELAMNLDQNKNDPLRYVIYRTSAHLERMVGSLRAKENREGLNGNASTLAVEDWTRQALNLSRLDPPLGTLLTKSLRLMDTVEKEGIVESRQCFPPNHLRDTRIARA